jgi:hypothetical protein
MPWWWGSTASRRRIYDFGGSISYGEDAGPDDPRVGPGTNGRGRPEPLGRRSLRSRTSACTTAAAAAPTTPATAGPRPAPGLARRR